MIHKMGVIVKKNILISCVMCLFTLLLFFLLEKQGYLTVRFLGMGFLLFLINIMYSNIVHKSKGYKYIKISLIAILVVINITFSLLTTIYLLADKMLFYPNQDEESYDLNRMNPEYEEIMMESEGGNIAGWLYKNVKGKAPLIIYFGGNGECSARRFRTNLDQDGWDAFKGYNFMMMDYPGYGKSEGKPSDEAMYEMALNTYDYALSRDDVDPNHVVVLGFSIGTGVSTYLASQRDIKALILWAPYNSGLGLYNSKLNIFYGPLVGLVKNVFKANEFARSVKVTPLILATKDDEMIPYLLSKEQSENFAEGSELILYEGFKHNDFWSETQVLDKVKEYLQEVIHE